MHGDCIRQQQRDCWKRYACNAARIALRRTIDACTGYGGGVSVYFGLSVGLQLLDVAFFTLALLRNHFTRCSVIRSVSGNAGDEYGGFFFGGNVYGGGISIYMGGYSSIKVDDIAVAAVGNTVVRNSSVLVETVSFTSCRATTASGKGANSYGGSLSLYLGGYAWSQSLTFTSSAGSSSSTSGSTTASGVSVSISNVNSSYCSATTTGSNGGLYGGNSYGGSISLYLGGYAWSYCSGISISSSSTSGLTTASGVSVSISNVNSSNCSAASYPLANNKGASWGVNSYGGSMSVIYIGAYAWSSAAGIPGGEEESRSSSSVCGTTNVTSLVVSISSSTFADSSAGSRTFHSSAPLFSFPCAYSRSSAEFGDGDEVSGSNVRAFAISAPSAIVPALPSDARSSCRCTAAPPVS